MYNEKLKDLIFYEIYPTSFYDSNNDGIGDLKGIEEKLTYVKDLGFNAIWLNPFYKSPFDDGGYDVSDFFDVDPKFGTLADWDSLIKKAHELGIKIIIDLVAGHASEENPVFKKSAEPVKNEYSDLFIWNDSVWTLEPGYRLISGRYQRDACFMVNFFEVQPAFNYGFYNIEYPWQMSYKDERTFKAREYLLSIMRFWLSRGADGFRVDMAESLVKNDPEKIGIVELWNYFFNIIRKEFPESIFVSEWNDPEHSLKAGFDIDFNLNWGDCWYCKFIREFNGKVDTSTRTLRIKNLTKVVENLKKRVEVSKNNGFMGNISGNHDSTRLATVLDETNLRTYYLMQFVLPGIPFVYYGDEIAMEQDQDMISKDGGFYRTGCRTPMQWDLSKNGGFSKTDNELYLPTFVVNKVNVEDAKKDPNSIYNYMKKLIEIRKQYPQLTSQDCEINEKDNILTIKRQDLTLIMNFSDNVMNIDGDKYIIGSNKNKNTLNKFESVLLK